MTQNTTPTTDAYIPGVCNINRAEIAYRQRSGYVITAVFIAMLIAFVALGLNRWIRLSLFLPGFLLADCFLQAKNKFCVGYGAAGQHNANEGSSKAVDVADAAAKAKDKQRARTINMQAAGIGVVLTLLALAIPQ
ncbi:MAG: hypothetical protein QFB86_03960 [Patescibacteria group bacterium]|nr:hypothetical protein [Patescibacteria group bacterium]